jgi:hypothetical protein
MRARTTKTAQIASTLRNTTLQALRCSRRLMDICGQLPTAV